MYSPYIIIYGLFVCTLSTSISVEKKYMVQDSWQCAAYYMGADYESNPFISKEVLRKLPDGESILAGTKQFDSQSIVALQEVLEDAYPGMRFGYNSAICGRACWRACLNHLEKKHVLTKSYKNPLERSGNWKN